MNGCPSVGVSPIQPPLVRANEGKSKWTVLLQDIWNLQVGCCNHKGCIPSPQMCIHHIYLRQKMTGNHWWKRRWEKEPASKQTLRTYQPFEPNSLKDTYPLQLHLKAVPVNLMHKERQQPFPSPCAKGTDTGCPVGQLTDEPGFTDLHTQMGPVRISAEMFASLPQGCLRKPLFFLPRHGNAQLTQEKTHFWRLGAQPSHQAKQPPP